MAAATSATLASDQNQRSDPAGSIGMVGGPDFNFDEDMGPGLMGSPSISETGSQAGVTSLAHQGSISNASDLLLYAGLRQHAVANQQPQQAGTQNGQSLAFGQDGSRGTGSGTGSADGRRVSTSDIQLVQNLIERCMQLYMSQAEVVVSLEEQASIERGFTALVWQKLEEQNEDFFRAYYTRLKLKDQIVLFNHLLEQQVQMVHRIRASAAWMAPNGMHVMGPRPGMMIPGMPITGQPPALGSIGAMMQSGMLLPSQQQPLTIAPLPGGQTPQQMGAMQMGFMPDGSQPLTSLPQPIDSLTSPLLHTAPLSMPAPGFPIASNDGSLPTSIPTAGLGLQTGEDGTPHAGTESGLGGPNMTTAAPRIPGQQGQDNNPQAPTGLGSKGPEAGSHGALSEFARSLSLGVSVPSPGLEGTSATGELLGMPPNLHPSTGDLAGLLPTLSPARGMMGPPSSSARADGQAQDPAGDLHNIPRNFSLSDLGIGLDHDSDHLGFGGIMPGSSHGDGHPGTHDLPQSFSFSELAALDEEDEQGES